MKVKISLLIAIIMLTISCSHQNSLIGVWNDIIKLSQKEVEFNSTVDSVIITTQGDWWWVSSVQISDSVYYGFKGIDLEQEHYKIVENDFVVERCDKNTLFIQLNENKIGRQRVATICLEAGDYFGYVVVT